MKVKIFPRDIKFSLFHSLRRREFLITFSSQLFNTLRQHCIYYTHFSHIKMFLIHFGAKNSVTGTLHDDDVEEI